GASCRRGRGARVGCPRRDDKRHSPQRRAPLRNPRQRRKRPRRARDRGRRPCASHSTPRKRAQRASRACAARARRSRSRDASRGRVSATADDPAGELMIRVLIAEDQAMVRGALASLLALEGDIDVVAEVERGDRVLAVALETRPDVALLDIEMPGLDGISAAGELARELPATRSVILTTFRRPGYMRRALANGASGFLLKDAPASELAAAIRVVVA